MLAHGAHGTFLLGAGGWGPRCERPQRAPGTITGRMAHLVTSEVWLWAAPVSLPRQHREGPANSPQQSGPRTLVVPSGWEGDSLGDTATFGRRSSRAGCTPAPPWDMHAPVLSLPGSRGQHAPRGWGVGAGARWSCTPSGQVPRDVGVCQEWGLGYWKPKLWGLWGHWSQDKYPPVQVSFH